MSRQSYRKPKDEGGTKNAKIRVGPDFQAEIPLLLLQGQRTENVNELIHHADLLFEPGSAPIIDEEIVNDTNMKSLSNPAVRWSTEEKLNFKKCLTRHKKKFNRYKDLLPNKTIVQLLDYYYSTKKERREATPDDKYGRDPDYSPSKVAKKGRPPKKVQQTAVKLLFNRTPDRVVNTPKLRFGITEIEQIVDTGDKTDLQLENLRAKSVQLKGEIGRNTKDESKIDHYRRWCKSYNPSTGGTTAWTDSELILAVHAIRLYGKDFKAVAKLIGNKTEGQVKIFFANYRERYNLEAMVNLFEEDRKNGVLASLKIAESTVGTTSPVKKIIRSPLKKPSILVRRKV